MLDALIDYLADGKLPYFFGPKHNLLDLLNDDEIESYKEALIKSCSTLKSYRNEPQLTASRCREHFV